MDNTEGLKELAWLYLKFEDALNSMPSYIGDFVGDPPKWFKTDEDDDNLLGAMIDVADKAARRLLKK